MAKSNQLTQEGYVQMIAFDPDGAPTTGTGIASVRIIDKDNNAAQVTLAQDGWGYEFSKEDANAQQGH